MSLSTGKAGHRRCSELCGKLGVQYEDFSKLLTLGEYSSLSHHLSSTAWTLARESQSFAPGTGMADKFMNYPDLPYSSLSHHLSSTAQILAREGLKKQEVGTVRERLGHPGGREG